MQRPGAVFLLVLGAFQVSSDVYYEGYVYPPPLIPAVQLDEPPAVIFEDPYYLPPINNEDSVVVVPPSLPPPQVRIENMSCVQGINFRATFKMINDSPLRPILEDSSEGCISFLEANLFKIDLDGFNSMIKCGVRRCKSGTNMCAVLRLPTVKGVRLPEDGIVTLMCTPQERVASQTKHVKLGRNKIQQNSRGRSSGSSVATGGTQMDLKTKIGVFRKRPGSASFDQNVLSDSVIHLGEELVLRAVINEGDGWTNSQIGPVLITGVNSKKSALLLDQHGCINPVMKSICPRQPFKVSPFVTELHFRAFLFQESPQGDEMVVSVRTLGCLHAQDCVRAEPCRNNDSSARTKRELKDVKDWESSISFKVESMPKSENHEKSMSNRYLIVGSMALTGLALGLFVVSLVLWQLFHRG